MEIGRLAAILAVILNHAPKATADITAYGTVLRINYHGPITFDLEEWEASCLDDHRVGLYDGYAEIML
jgi:hypothetical protein